MHRSRVNNASVPLPPDSVDEIIMFSGCPSFVHSSGQILLTRYLTNGLSNLDETFSEYSIAHADVRFWRSKVKVTAGCQVPGIHIDVKALKSIF